jgi:hypothetical protein
VQVCQIQPLGQVQQTKAVTVVQVTHRIKQARAVAVQIQPVEFRQVALAEEWAAQVFQVQ